MDARENGFTLLELLITIAIAALLLGIAVPSYQSLISSTRISTHTGKLFNALVMTRSRAITSGKRTILCPTRNGTQCNAGNKWDQQLIIFEDRNRNGRRDPDSEPIMHTTEPADQLHVFSGSSYGSAGGRKRVAYFPTGHSYGSTITLTLCDKQGATEPRLILLSNSGRPRVSSYRSDGSKPQCP
ncbi:MAG: GspH/FimT family pseudopilin [Pseudomonadota bacterium]